MMLINNINVLLRMRSRLVSTAFLALSIMCGCGTQSYEPAVVQLSIVTALLILTFIYKNKDSVGFIFYAFLCLGLCSLIFKNILFLGILLFIFTLTPLNVMSFRGFNAILFALLLPYIYFGLYETYINNSLEWTSSLIYNWEIPKLFDYESIRIGTTLSYFIMLILFIVSTVHFINYKYEDKIRARSILGLMITLGILLIIAVPIIPGYANILLPLLCIPTSILSAHFFAHTRKRATNILFKISILLIFITAIINQCSTLLSNLVPGAYF